MNSQPPAQGIPLSQLAWLVALLPFVTTHVSYLLAAWMGHVPWCVPYWDSCTSISATGRELPEKIWFKLGMIPAGLAAMCLWWCAAAWHRHVLGNSTHPRTLAAVPWLGTLAAMCLILYTIALGEEGDAYRLLRRTGVTLSFALTYLSQLLMTRLIGEMATRRQDAWLQRWHDHLFVLSSLLLVVGISSVTLEIMAKDVHREVEDAFEWVMALLLNCYFVGMALIWRRGSVMLAVTTPWKLNQSSER